MYAAAGPVKILNGLDFAIGRQGIHCIIGPNGAGKTSALNALTGKLPIGRGTISWRGQALSGTRPHQAASLGIGRKFQVPSVFPGLTIRQNIDIALWANRLAFSKQFSMTPYLWKSRLLDTLEMRFPFLRDDTRPAGALSVGQRQMLDFAMTFLAEPSLVLLDEPCAGLSTAETAQMIEAIAVLNAETHATSIIVEHDMDVVERLSDHVIVMNDGALLADGPLQDVRNDPKVQRVYAGGAK